MCGVRCCQIDVYVVGILLRDCGENRCVIVLRILCMLRLKVVEISMVTNVKLKIQIY